MSNPYQPGFQILALPFTKHVWQFTIFAVGQEIWPEYDEDHDSAEYITWYFQLAFWQVSLTRELK